MNSSLRAAVIAEWRGLPGEQDAPDRWQAPGDLLPKLMQQLGLSERLRESEVIDAWKQSSANLSPPIPRRSACAPGFFSCACSNRRLHYQFEQISKAEILRKLKQRFGDEDHPRNSFSRRLARLLSRHADPANLHLARPQLFRPSRPAAGRFSPGRSAADRMRRRPRNSRRSLLRLPGNYKGQITFFSSEVFERLGAALWPQRINRPACCAGMSSFPASI